MGKPSPPRTSIEGSGANEPGMEEEEAPMVVLPSSTELFHFYAQSLEQCAKLSTGQPLFDLYKVQKKWLRIYAGAFSRGFSLFDIHLCCRGDPDNCAYYQDSSTDWHGKEEYGYKDGRGLAKTPVFAY